MDRQLGQPPLQPILLTYQAYRLRQLQDRRQKAVGDKLGRQIGYAHTKGDKGFPAAMAKDVFQLRTGLENLLGVGQGQVQPPRGPDDAALASDAAK